MSHPAKTAYKLDNAQFLSTEWANGDKEVSLNSNK